jgi:site-specific recombinase XerD
MYLSRRSKSVYYLWYKDDAGRKHKVSTRTTLKSEAIQFLREFRVTRVRSAKSMRLSEFVAEFLAFAGTTYSPKTVDIYHRVFGIFQKQAGDLLLQSVTARHIDQYKALRLNNKRKAVSVNIELRALKAAFNVAKRWKLIDENPCADIGQISIPDELPHFFTTVDFEKLLATMPQAWLREMVVLAVLTGMRRGELCNLKWQDIDFSAKVVQIHSSATFRTKQGKRRVVALNSTAYLLLQARKELSPSEYVFTLNDKKIRDQHAGRLFKRAVRAAKLSDQQLHFHSLRHTFASWLVQNGASLYQVQKLLGHSNPRITQVYAHLQPSEMHEIVERLPLTG